jgi:hypothetical protein
MYDSWCMFTILTVSLMTKPCFLLLPKRIMYDSLHNPLRRKQGVVISETVSIVNILQLSYIILLDNRRKQGFVISETVSIVNIHQLSYIILLDNRRKYVYYTNCFTNDKALFSSKRFMYDSWCMFTMLTVSLMTKPCFLLWFKRIMYDSWSMFTILTVSLMLCH